jgi:hypothetical protein
MEQEELEDSQERLGMLACITLLLVYRGLSCQLIWQSKYLLIRSDENLNHFFPSWNSLTKPGCLSSSSEMGASILSVV